MQSKGHMTASKKTDPATAVAKAERKAEALKYLKTARDQFPDWSQASQIKLAVARYILDEAGVKGPERQDAATAYMETPSWFGASANALQELPDYVKKLDKTVKEFTA